MQYKVTGDFEEVKEHLGYSKEDLLFDYQCLQYCFGEYDEDVKLFRYIIDNYSMLYFWYPSFAFLKDFYKKEV
jgi:hypothetical protein